MPELAMMYAAGLLAVWICAGLVIALEIRLEKSEKIMFLQRNLAALELRFSHARDEVISLSEQRSISQLRTLGLLAAFCSFLSWPGLLFFVVIVVSLAKLAHVERKVLLASPLSQGEMSSTQSEAILNQVSESYRNLARAKDLR